MKILFFTDCMSHSPADLDILLRYPFLVQKSFENVFDFPIDIDVVSARGATTFEAIDELKILQQHNKRYDFIFFAYGINDALPRGLTRNARGKLIRFMFTCKLPKKIRLMCRFFFLNPLEYLMQFIRKPFFYNDIDTFIKNVSYIMDELSIMSVNKPIYISANPVLNYRFLNANKYIKRYNDQVIKFLSEQGYSSIRMFDVFKLEKLKKYLAKDKFHYGELGHQVLADAIIEHIEKIQISNKEQA